MVRSKRKACMELFKFQTTIDTCQPYTLGNQSENRGTTVFRFEESRLLIGDSQEAMNSHINPNTSNQQT